MAAKNKPNGKNSGRGNGGVGKDVSAKQRGGREASLANLKPWGPGESGNPKGRATNPHSLTAALREVMGWKIAGEIPAIYKKMFPESMPADPTVVQLFAMRAVIKALDIKQGDVMMKELWERLDGKVPFPISGAGGEPIPFKLDLSDLPTNDLEQLRKILNKVRQEV